MMEQMQGNPAPIEGLPGLHIGRDGSSSEDIFAALHETLSTVFDIARTDRNSARAFNCDLSTYNLGRCIIVNSRMAGLVFHRTPATIARSGVDHYVLQLVLSGVYCWEIGGDGIVLQPGDIGIIDLARPIATAPSSFENISLIFPRDALAPLLADPDGLHGLVLPRGSAAAAILGDHVRTLSRHAGGMSMAQAMLISGATFALIASCVGASGPGPTALPVRARLTAARRYIDARLSSPDLSPSVIEDHLGMSRSALYRLFEPFGGVAYYINQRRMSRAFQCIAADVQGVRRIGDIASSVGIVSEAGFSRAFRRSFGICPREARAAARQAAYPAPSGATAMRHWLHNLSAVTDRSQ